MIKVKDYETLDLKTMKLSVVRVEGFGNKRQDDKKRKRQSGKT